MSLTSKKAPNWQRSAIHSAIALAFTNVVFVAPSAAIQDCTPTSSISTALTATQRPCNNDTVTVTSTGSVKVEGSGNVVTAFQYQSLDGSLANAGTISAINAGAIAETYSAFAGAFGVSISQPDTLAGSLSNSGTISATVAGAQVSSVRATGVYTSGLLSGSLTNSGTISAAVSGGHASSVEAYGVAVDGELRGSLTNSGTISATVSGGRYGWVDAVGVGVDASLSGSLTNSGTISAAASGGDGMGVAFGVEVGGGINGSLTNSGAINATASSNTFEGGKGFRRPSNAAIAYGVHVNGISGSFANSGAINATATLTTVDGGEGYGQAEAIGVRTTELSGSFTNSGTINATATLATADGGEGFAVGVELLAGSSYHGMGDTLRNAGTLTNTGMISATANGNGGAAYGVAAPDGFSGTLNNSGRITASAPSGTAYSLYIGDGGEGGKGATTPTGVINNQAGGFLGGNLVIGSSVREVTNAGTIFIPSQLTATIIERIDGGEGGDAMPHALADSGPINAGGVGYIAGNYTQLAGGRVDLGVSNATSYGSLHVGGTADLRASNLIGIHAKPNNTLLAGDKLTNVLSSDNPLLGVANGTSVSVVGTPLFGFSGAGNAENGIDVTVTSKSTFTGILGKGVANALDGLVTGYSGTGAMDPLLDALYGLDSVDELKDVATRLAPSLSDGMNRTAASVIGDVNRIINSRQFANRGQSSGDSFYGDRYFWFKPFGSYAKQGEHSDVMGYNANSYGLVFGVDGEISDTTRIGGAFAYATSNVDGESSTVKQSGDVDSYLLTAYGSHSLDAVTNVNFQAGYGVQRNDSKRVIAVGGLWALPTSTATADYNGWSANLGVGVERAYAINQSTTFIPSVRADYIKVHNDGYNEKGAGVLNLDVGSSKAESLVLGVDGKFDFAIDETSKITANLGIGYDVLNDQGSVTSAFVGGGGAFTTDGTDQSPWVYRGGLGYVMSKTKSLELSVRYDIEGRSSDFTNQTGSLNLRMPF